MKISKKELNKIFIQEKKRLDRDYRRMFKRGVTKQKSSALNEAYRPQNIDGGPPYRQNPNRGTGAPTDMLSRYIEGDDDVEEDDELTDAYTIGPYGIITMEGLRNAILQEMNRIEEGMFDFLKPRGGRWKDATGIEHNDMGGGPGPVPLDRASHDLAVELANRIETHASGWSGPESGGMTADYERAGWHRIADHTGQGHWTEALHSVGPHTAAQAEAVLEKWGDYPGDGFITRVQPEVLRMQGQRPDSGIWLRWSGYKEMKRLRDESGQSGSMQYSY